MWTPFRYGVSGRFIFSRQAGHKISFSFLQPRHFWGNKTANILLKIFIFYSPAIMVYNTAYMYFSLGGLFKNFKLALNPQKSVLGLDIGSSFVKLVQLRKEQERAILETYGEIALGPYAKMKIGQNVKLSPDNVAQAIKDLIKESNSKTGTVRVSIPLKSSFVKIITLPFGQEKNISAEVIAMEARRHIPVPVSEVALDWWVIPESENDLKNGGEKETEVLLVAIHNDVIGEYKDIIAKAGLTASSFEIESFSLVRSGISRGSPTIAVMDIGLSDLPEHQDIVAVMEPILDYIFHEAAVFLKDFQNKYGRPASKVIFSGGGSLLKGLAGYGVKKLTVEVEYANPFGKTDHPAFLSGVLKGIGPDFSVAAGLALGDLSKQKKHCRNVV